MTETTCMVDDCDRPRHQAQKYCGSHYMKLYRHGDPLYQYQPKFVDLTGRRFGALSVLRRENRRWVCSCDCGNETVVRAGDLNRGTTRNCGNQRTHRRLAMVDYCGAHDRIRSDKGPASAYDCVDCGLPAKQWSYDHSDPDELISTSARGPFPFSLNSEHYQPRCMQCHRRFDLSAAGKASHQMT